jgi:carboxypeptidase family protein
MRSVAVFALRHLVFAFLSIFIIHSVWAQSNRGSIAGSVLDSSGGAVANAAVSAKSVDTGTVYNTTSTGTGAYRISELVPGAYDLSVTAKGFKVSENKGVVIQINTTASLDVTLQPGDVKESLTVFADAPTIQSESSDIGTVVGLKQIEQLPLSIAASGQGFIRSPEAFIFLTPGTAGPGTNSDHGSAGTFETKLAGGQNFGTEVILDGASTSRMDTSAAFTQTAPSVEALTEFKVTTSTIPAEFGRTSGGVESFSTRSGSNNFHGNAFEIYKNDKFDANSWYNNMEGLPKPRDHKNNYGGTLGGPVWIPKVYDGKNKSFFFFSWEQYRQAQGIPVTSTLPTAAERNGDFSALLGAPVFVGANPLLNPCDNNNQVLQGQIFDPTTTRTVNGTQCRSPFPGNIIPSGDLSKVAQNVLGYVPTPAGAAPANNNFTYTATNANLDTAWTVRGDQNVGNNNKLYFSYNSRNFQAPNGPSNLPGPINQNYLNTFKTYYLRFGWDSTIQGNLLNHLNVGLNRINSNSKGYSVTGVDWDQVLGIANASGQVFPQFNFNSSPSGFSYVGYSTPQDNSNLPNSLVVDDSVAWIKGRHSLRIGIEWRSYQFSILSQAFTSPSYTFSPNQTSFKENDTSTGDSFASFMLGSPQQASLTVYSVYPRWNANYFAAFIQDDFKFRKDLTLNLGFRYDIDTPRYEAHDAQSNLSLTTANPGTPGQPGAYVYGPYAILGNTFFKDFSPRVGFAYSPEALFGHVRNLVVRGGYSIYYAPLTYSDFGLNFLTGTSASPSFTSADNFTPLQSPDVGFPTYAKPPSFDPAVYNGQSPNYVAPQYGKPGMVQNWSLQIQKQLAQDLILSVGYVGMHSTRLRSSLAQPNNLTPKYYDLNGAAPACGAGQSYGPSVLNDAYNSCTGSAALSDLGVTVPPWLPGLYGGSPTVGQVLRPYPQFQSIATDGGLENLGQSTYHAGLVSLERRFRNGLNLMASYTFSKTLTDADSNYPLFTSFNSGVWAQDSFNLKNNKAVSYQDIPQIFVLSYVYELPVGPNKKFLDKKGVVGKIVGGWQVSGVQRYQSGSPISFTCGFPVTSIPRNDGNICADRVPGQSWLAGSAGSFNPGNAVLALKSGGSLACNGIGSAPTNLPAGIQPYFNCAGFADTNSATSVAARGYAFGNIPRTVGNIRSAHYYNEDFSVIKNTYITENQFIQFRADFLNAFNRHTFAVPDTNYSDSTFGIPGSGGAGMVINSPKTVQFSLRYQF